MIYTSMSKLTSLMIYTSMSFPLGCVHSDHEICEPLQFSETIRL